MKKSLSIYLIFCIGILVAGCGNKGKSETAAETHAEEEHAHENPATISLNAEQMKSIGLELGRIEQKQLTSSLKANGILKVPNQNKATATVLYGGVVQSILVQPGNTVKKGQVLATIANPEFIQLQEDYLTTASQITLAELEYERQKELSGGNAGALKRLQQSEAELKTLKTKKASLHKQLELAGINASTLNNDNIRSTVNIVSPISGSVSSVSVNIGSRVDINTSVAEIVDNSQLHLDLYVYEKDLPKLKEGQTIHFTLTNNPGKEYDADIFGISNTFEDASKAIAVHAAVKGDKSGLIDGMNITALVSLDNATLPAVPTEAIVNHEGQDYIFIVTDDHAEAEHRESEEGHDHDEAGHHHDDDEKTPPPTDGLTFERIPVRRGTTDVGYTEIALLKDVPANVRIVVKGAFFVWAKMTNQGEGHAH